MTVFGDRVVCVCWYCVDIQYIYIRHSVHLHTGTVLVADVLSRFQTLRHSLSRSNPNSIDTETKGIDFVSVSLVRRAPNPRRFQVAGGASLDWSYAYPQTNLAEYLGVTLRFSESVQVPRRFCALTQYRFWYVGF